MKLFQEKKNHACSVSRERLGERGTVYAETTLIVPLLLLLIFAPININTWYERHSALSSAAAQVARIGAALSPLSECVSNCSEQTGHDELLGKAMQIIEAAGFSSEGATVNTVLRPAQAGVQGSPMVVEVEISIPYNPIGINFVLLPNIVSRSVVAQFNSN